MPILLVVSLALNLLVGGMVAARFIWHERMQSFSGASHTQLLPRRFLSDLSDDRRKELLAILKTYRASFSEGRSNLSDAAAKVAAALKATPYDEAALKASVAGFTKVGGDMVANGEAAMLDIISRLTPEERASLAQRIIERGQSRR